MKQRQNRQQKDENKSCYFEKILKSDNLLTRLIKRKEETQMKSEMKDIIEIQRIRYFKKLHANKLDN